MPRFNPHAIRTIEIFSDLDPQMNPLGKGDPENIKLESSGDNEASISIRANWLPCSHEVEALIKALEKEGLIAVTQTTKRERVSYLAGVHDLEPRTEWREADVPYVTVTIPADSLDEIEARIQKINADKQQAMNTQKTNCLNKLNGLEEHILSFKPDFPDDQLPESMAATSKFVLHLRQPDCVSNIIGNYTPSLTMDSEDEIRERLKHQGYDDKTQKEIDPNGYQVRKFVDDQNALKKFLKKQGGDDVAQKKFNALSRHVQKFLKQAGLYDPEYDTPTRPDTELWIDECESIIQRAVTQLADQYDVYPRTTAALADRIEKAGPKLYQRR